MRIYDYLRPGLVADSYTIDYTLDLSGVTGPPKTPPQATGSFTVQAPRFALDPSEIHAVYPPANAVGPYSDTLPHVVLSTRALPWERTLAGLPPASAGKDEQPPPVPWLALLVFDASELEGVGSRSPTGTVTMQVGELVDALAATSKDYATDVSDAERALMCQTLEIPASLLAAVAQRLPDEVRLLAHVREVDTGDDADVGHFALVVANRTPRPGTSIAHLVSLEGYESLLDGTAAPAPRAQIRLVSLASWSFTTTPASGESFDGLASGLATPGAGERDDLALGLPFDVDDRKLDPTDARRKVADRLADGYVPVSYHLPTGEDTFAWYRGPFAPRQSQPVGGRPFAASSAALVYDEDAGVFDVSLAAAWEIGRALALADRKFATDLVRFRRGVHRLVDLVLAGLQSWHLDAEDGLGKIAQQGLIEQRFLDLLRHDLAGQVAALSQGAAPQPGPSPAATERPTDPVGAVKELLQRRDLEDLIAAETADDLQPIAAWLCRLASLEDVPFAYLVAHPQLLPVESARFFTVDVNWIGALVDGALAVGTQSSRDTWFQAVAGSIVPDAWKAAEKTTAAAGLLLRSALVAGWPGLVVEASSGGQPVALVRGDLLAPSVLLCLFGGVPDHVVLRSPPQGLHFELKDGQQKARSGAAERVQDIAGLAGSAGPAAFAAQMLAQPHELTFAR